MLQRHKEPETMQCTTAWSSHRSWIHKLRHSGPHTWAAMAMGSNSWSSSPGRGSTCRTTPELLGGTTFPEGDSNHRPLRSSESYQCIQLKIWGGVHFRKKRKLQPFQQEAKACHHLRSSLEVWCEWDCVVQACDSGLSCSGEKYQQVLLRPQT
jgi:hypothetical protein